MLAGYQAEGTRGRQMLEGCPEIKFHGKYYPVNAQVEYLESLSAHADQPELLQWVDDIEDKPKRVFLIHGEPQALDMMRLKLKDIYGWEVQIPELFEIVEIEF
jgi:metallo-beta-lactamase family protein